MRIKPTSKLYQVATNCPQWTSPDNEILQDTKNHHPIYLKFSFLLRKSLKVNQVKPEKKRKNNNNKNTIIQL